MKKRHINIQLLYTSKVIFSSLKKKKIIQKTNLLYHDMELLVFFGTKWKRFYLPFGIFGKCHPNKQYVPIK